MNFGQLALATLHQHPGPAADIRPTILGSPNPRGLDSAYPQTKRGEKCDGPVLGKPWKKTQ